MRGSVEYQTAQLTQKIFRKGIKKQERTNPNSDHYSMVSSYQTMASYRQVWNNLFHYLREHWGIKNCEKIEDIHIAAYMDYKIEYYPSKQYLEKISAAIGKLEVALKRYTLEKYCMESTFDFSVRKKILKAATDLNRIATNYNNRAYRNPKSIIEAMTCPLFRLAAMMQLEGGVRLEGVGLIKKEQLKGYRTDMVTMREVGVIETKEKGGKIGDILMSRESYQQLEKEIDISGKFQINRAKYMQCIRKVCRLLQVNEDGSHGFRWSYAQQRMLDYAKGGYTYEQSLQLVSQEMKHNRANITEHYLG